MRLDARKAFDRLEHSRVGVVACTVLLREVLPVVAVLLRSHASARMRLRFDGKAEHVPVSRTRGCLQGASSSGLLWTLVLSDALMTAEEHWTQWTWAQMPGGAFPRWMSWADDVVLLAVGHAALAKWADIVSMSCRVWGVYFGSEGGKAQ